MQLQRPFSSLSTKRRIKLVVAYDGSQFRGFAPQRGQRTVHSTLTEAIRQLSGEDVEMLGASRTDSGANARGQVCHFDTENPMPEERWTKALNQLLPNDMAVMSSEHVDDEFHSRFWAVKRYYRYRILTDQPDPERTRYAFHYNKKQLDLDAMQAASKHFIGKHDFLAFSQLLEPWQTSIRELYEFDVTRVRDEIRIDVVGSAFVRGMMRRMSGAIWEVGRGVREPDDIERLLLLKEKKKINWPAVLPACGLTLMKVYYGRHPRERVRGVNRDLGEE